MEKVCFGLRQELVEIIHEYKDVREKVCNATTNGVLEDITLFNDLLQKKIGLDPEIESLAKGLGLACMEYLPSEIKDYHMTITFS